MIEAPVGTHCILEIHGCPFDKLNDEAFVRHSLAEASRHGMSTLLQLTSHKFDPQGVTSLALLAESHISIHTWPETGYAALDVFTCGPTARPKLACEYLIEAFSATDHSLRILPRGGPVKMQHATSKVQAGQASDSDSLHLEACTSHAQPAQEAALCQALN